MLKSLNRIFLRSLPQKIINSSHPFSSLLSLQNCLDTAARSKLEQRKTLVEHKIQSSINKRGGRKNSFLKLLEQHYKQNETRAWILRKVAFGKSHSGLLILLKKKRNDIIRKYLGITGQNFQTMRRISRSYTSPAQGQNSSKSEIDFSDYFLSFYFLLYFSFTSLIDFSKCGKALRTLATNT